MLGVLSPITVFLKRLIVEAMKPEVTDMETDMNVPFTLMEKTYLKPLLLKQTM